MVVEVVVVVVRLEDVMEDCMGCVVGRDGDGHSQWFKVRSSATPATRQGKRSKALTRSLGRFLQLATRTPHAQHPHQTTMNRTSGQSQSQKGCLCHGHRGLARKRRRAGEHPAARKLRPGMEMEYMATAA